MRIAIKERPILFSGPMVKAILEGRKTQTRRPAKPPTKAVFLPDDHWRNDPDEPGTAYLDDFSGRLRISCPYGQEGDRLWVRETWQSVPIVPHRDWPGLPDDRPRKPDPHRSVAFIYRADGEMPGDEIWRPSIHMPRWASRITLEITDVRVERLQGISHEDALAEGCTGYNWVASSPYIIGPHTDDGELPQEEYQALWDSINGHGSWDANPFVWVISFRRIIP